MDDELKAELRKLFEEEILVHLREIGAKLDLMNEQMERHYKAMEARLAAIMAEQAEYQAERRGESPDRGGASAKDTLPPKRFIQ
jgi:hypothetical protein